jgi:hypothetical protein
MRPAIFAAAAFAVSGLTGCGAASPASSASSAASPTPDVVAWTSMVSADASTLSKDFTAVVTPLQAGDVTGAQTALTSMAGDVAAFENDLSSHAVPSAFKTTTATIQTALADYQTGIQDATGALEGGDPSQLAVATTLFTEGNSLMQKALTQIGQ